MVVSRLSPLHKSDSFRFPQGFYLDQANSRIFLPKLGWLRYRKSRALLGTVCISQTIILHKKNADRSPRSFHFSFSS
jgi:hypothetical protein